jgi:hypothetical protein
LVAGRHSLTVEARSSQSGHPAMARRACPTVCVLLYYSTLPTYILYIQDTVHALVCNAVPSTVPAPAAKHCVGDPERADAALVSGRQHSKIAEVHGVLLHGELYI